MCTALTDDGAEAPLSVLKFGSSLLRSGSGFRTAASEVGRELARGRRVVVVVSAVAGDTDGLLERAGWVSDAPGRGLLAILLRTGEEAAVALMGLTLVEAGIDWIPAVVQAPGTEPGNAIVRPVV